jgi:hypothetical protein
MSVVPEKVRPIICHPYSCRPWDHSGSKWNWEQSGRCGLAPIELICQIGRPFAEPQFGVNQKEKINSHIRTIRKGPGNGSGLEMQDHALTRFAYGRTVEVPEF